MGRQTEALGLRAREIQILPLSAGRRLFSSAPGPCASATPKRLESGFPLRPVRGIPEPDAVTSPPVSAQSRGNVRMKSVDWPISPRAVDFRPADCPEKSKPKPQWKEPS